MPAAQRDGSDRIGTEHGTDISELAEEFAIDPDMLEAALGDADRLLRMSWENIHTADKRALRGTTKALAELIDRLSSDALRERLIEAVVQVPNGPDDEELAKYEAWWAAQDRVDRAIAGAQDLLAIVRAGEALPIANWAAGIPTLDRRDQFLARFLGLYSWAKSDDFRSHIRPSWGQTKPDRPIRASMHALAW